MPLNRTEHLPRPRRAGDGRWPRAWSARRHLAVVGLLTAVALGAFVALLDRRGSHAQDLTMLAVVAAAGAAATWVLSERVVRPLCEVAEGLRRSEEDPVVRVPVHGSAEVAELAEQVNAVLDLRSVHEAQLEHRATHDAVTGLPGLALFTQHLDDVLAGDTGCVALLHVRVARFDTVYDGLGHAAAERVLATLADRLESVLPAGAYLARFGRGDEFFVVLRATSRREAVGVAGTLRHAVGRPVDGPDGPIVLEADVGVATSTVPHVDADHLLREGAAALRHAVATKDRLAVYDPVAHALPGADARLEAELREALRAGQLRLHYQPVVQVRTGRTVGVEALVRWQHPARGLLLPAEFLPLDERSELAHALGSYVLTEACRQAGEWARSGHDLRVSVNVTVDQLQHDGFALAVSEALFRGGLRADRLCLEITETSLARDVRAVVASIELLRDLGVLVAVDDFGTGYSSLSYLHDLPVDELKIDRAFVTRMVRDHRDRHLVHAIVGMGRALGLTVVAEGVEQPEELDLLVELGCDLAQGHLFSRPLAADRLEPFLAARTGGVPR